ncbi:XRE family transcriptional regulator [Enterococcus durans]|uniref:XRE family transcriptional regulator n=1 Tax=Enterococcus durans TaxID=53345 RepID=UPI00189D58BA|nr:XRE family transcriptional regulator [Enterococcus durans]MDB1686244.1 XRE family transcriptional regulator [Enterococcus durans]
MNEIIKMKRLEKNMSLEEVGKLVGVGKSTVRKWENGMIENMGRDKIVALSKALDISPLDILGMSEKDLPKSSIETIYNQLEKPRQTKVYNFAEYQLREQNKRPKTTIEIRGYVSAGTGEWLEDEIVDEVSYEGVIPEHDFAVKVNGDSMLPLFEDGQVIFIKSTSDVRDGQIIVCQVNNEAFVKKLSGNKLVSLNKKYEDISICDTDDFKIYGVVVL